MADKKPGAWDRVKGMVAKVAPVLGNAILPGAGGVAGALVASALGVEAEPSAVEQALAVDPQAAVKLREIESAERTTLARIAAEQEVAQIQAETAQAQSVNETMRAEVNAPKWWSSAWRPFIGFVTGIAFLAEAVFIGVLMVKALETGQLANALSQIPAIVAALTGLFTPMCLILGIAAHHRGAMQRGV